MDFQLIAFYVFSIIAALSALAVISARNPVHAALFLVLTFFSSAAIWLLAEAEFLAIVLILVYVGAVMVLFLFVVMMLDIKPGSLREGFISYLPVGVIVAVAMVIEMLMLIGVQRLKQPIPEADPALAAQLPNTEWLGRALYTDYLYPFEIAAVILTVAIIAAIVITLRRREGTKHQDPARQVAVRREDRIRIIKMPAEGKEAGK